MNRRRKGMKSVRQLVCCCIAMFAGWMPGSLNAQTLIPVVTSNNALVLEAGRNKDLSIIYFGKKLEQRTGVQTCTIRIQTNRVITRKCSMLLTPAPVPVTWQSLPSP